MKRKTVLITGASKGIGAATARRFAEAGYDVAVNYLHGEYAAWSLVKELRNGGCNAIAVRADVSNPVQVQKMVDNVLDEYCQLDTLVCNAGISKTGLISDLTNEEWHRIFSVNVDGVFHCCKAALPHFVHRKSGCIVTVSSVWGLTGASCEVAYSATKAAVIGFTKALAKELGPSGITVNCVAPGVIDTEMNAHLKKEELEALLEETPLGKLGLPRDVAEAIFFFSSEGARFVTGQVLSPNGGIFV